VIEQAQLSRSVSNRKFSFSKCRDWLTKGGIVKLCHLETKLEVKKKSQSNSVELYLWDKIGYVEISLRGRIEIH
jgi:hypothetical protein